MTPYDHKKIEPKWQKKWDKEKAFAAIEKGKKPKWYSLIEFPYPSGDGLHVGHIRSNTAMDIVSRKRRREGYNVLYPIGWDAFGLPTENYAIKTGIQPAIVTKKNTETFRRQLKSLGFSFDYSREVNTTDPNYYRWTQWIFLKFLKAGLAYKKKMAINWCPKDLIGLANEEVVDGKCERCGTPVEKREKEQWMLAITKYADKLLEGLDATDYKMPCVIDHVNPPRADKPSKTRTNVHAIVYDPATKKYLIIRNKKFGWDTVVIGGVEAGEDFKESAIREVREETGYVDLEFKRILGGPVRAEYFAKHKDENRIAITTGVYFELKSDKRVPIDDADDREKGGFNEILWIDEADFVPGKMVNSELSIWLERLKDVSKGWPKPLLDWPDFIKDSQRNWIGKSEGASIKFELENSQKNKYVLLHGFTGKPTDPIYLWLKSELEKRGHTVVIPELPNTDNPSETEQVEAALKATDYDENTILYGHSLGTVVAMKVLEKLNKKIKSLVLTGGFVDPEFLDHERNFNDRFVWKFDANKIKSNCGSITLLHDINDVCVSNDQANRLEQMLSIPVQRVSAKEPHFDANKEPTILQALLPSIEVFTTRPDTLFGVTYVVLAPEHSLVRELLPTIKNKSEILVYLNRVKKESDIERTDAGREKTGVELKGVKAVNPVNGEEVPVFIADYVLADYGTGAVMAVPAHDDRDWDFAQKYGLPIKQVIAPYFENTTDLIPKKDKEMTTRTNIHAIIRNPKTGKYLLQKWKEFGWQSFVTGGVEAGEDLVEAAQREALEEVGYKNLKHIEKITDGWEVHSCFYAPHKDVNRYMIAKAVFFDLVDEEMAEVNNEEKNKYDLVWLDEDKVRDFLTYSNQKVSWDFCHSEKVFVDDGKLINSKQFDGKDSASIKKEITAFAGGQWISKYKLRDWVFSRQRYWGEPIPVVHCERCGIVPIPEKDLPVKLPPVKNYKPTETGESPLAAITRWVNTKCPNCKGKAKRETDTMPNWAGSSWYYLRYCDPKNSAKFADMKKLKYWTPVDWYNGGMEHVTLHLLYSRFWHKFLFDQGLVPTNEPYLKRTAHGLVLGPGGEKMSKSRGNVINPDGIVEKVGADSLRLYEMFMGSFDQAIAWDENGIVGCRRFLERVWKLQEKVNGKEQKYSRKGLSERAKASESETHRQEAMTAYPDGDVSVPDSQPKLISLIQKTIKKVGEDIENMRFNTAVSALMILLNEFEKEAAVAPKNYGIFLQLLAPFAPHITEELWNALGNKKSIHTTPWPVFDTTLLTESVIRIAVQVNGKTRAEMEITADSNDEEVKTAALTLESVKKWLNGGIPTRIIVVKGRLINIVVQG